MSTIRGFWKHTNGGIYAIESDTFGRIVGGAGPLDPNDLHDLDEYEYKATIVGWIQDAVAEHRLHRVNIDTFLYR